MRVIRKDGPFACLQSSGHLGKTALIAIRMCMAAIHSSPIGRQQ